LEAVIAEAFDFPMFKIFNVRGNELVLSDDEGASTDEDTESQPSSSKAGSGPSPPVASQQPAASGSGSAAAASLAPVSKPAGLAQLPSKGTGGGAKAGKGGKSKRRRARACKHAEVVEASTTETLCACICANCVEKRVAHFAKAYPKSLKLKSDERRRAELGEPLGTLPGIQDACYCPMCARRRVSEYERGTGRCAAKDASRTCSVCVCNGCQTARREGRREAYEAMCPCHTCDKDMQRYSKGWPVTRMPGWEDCCACSSCMLRRIDDHEAVQSAIKRKDAAEKLKQETAEKEAKNPAFKGLSGLAGALSKGVKSTKAAERLAKQQKAACMRRLHAGLSGGTSRDMMLRLAASPRCVLESDTSVAAPLDFQERWSAFETLEELGIEPEQLLCTEEIDEWYSALIEVRPRIESARKRGNSLFTSGKLPLAFRSYWTTAQLLHALQHMFYGDFLPQEAVTAVDEELGVAAAAILSNCLYVATTLKMWDEAEFVARMCASGWCATFPKHYLRLSSLLEEMGHTSAAYDAASIAVDIAERPESSPLLAAAKKRQDAASSCRGNDAARLGPQTSFESGSWPKRAVLTNALLCGTFEVVGVTSSVSVRQLMQRLRSAILLADQDSLTEVANQFDFFDANVLYTCPSSGCLRITQVSSLMSYTTLIEESAAMDGFLDTVQYKGKAVWGYPSGSASGLAEVGNSAAVGLLASAALHYYSIGSCGVSFLDEQFAAYSAHFNHCLKQHLQDGHEWSDWGQVPWACSLSQPLRPYYGLRFSEHTRMETAAQLPPRVADAPKPAGDELFAAYGYSCPHLEGTIGEDASTEVLSPCEPGGEFKLPEEFAAKSSGAAAGAAPAAARCAACAATQQERDELRQGNSGHVIKYSMGDDTAVRQNLMKSDFMRKIVELQLADMREK